MKNESNFEDLMSQIKSLTNKAESILSEHFGDEDEVNDSSDLKEAIKSPMLKLDELRSIISELEELEDELPCYSPDPYDVDGDR